MKKTTFSLIMILVPAILLSATVAFSQGLRDRMKERLPAILELKNKGVVGENNLGYLDFINNKKEKEDVVNAENKDREVLYQAMAKKNQEASVETVGQLAAASLAEKASPGHWLQDKTGKWYQKK